MSLSGPDALKALEEATRDVRREEDETATRLARNADLVTKFRETEGDLIRGLAARLEPQARAGLEDRLNQAELEAHEALEAHAARLAEVAATLAELDRAVAALATERGERVASAAASRRELDKLVSRIDGEQPAGSGLLGKRAEAAELRAIADASLEKLRLAEADRERKGRPYRDDRLFSYLWRRGYGTSEYRHRGIVAALDGWVAMLTGFGHARATFALLNELPLRLRDFADQRAQSAVAAQAELTALENAAIDAAGGQALRESLTAAEARIVAIDAELLQLEDQRDAAARLRRQLAEGREPGFAEAMSGLGELLRSPVVQTLLASARGATQAEDDPALLQIEEVRQRVAEEDLSAREERARLLTLAARRRELEDIQYELKTLGLDGARVSFADAELVGATLNAFLRGEISATAYLAQWTRGQKPDVRGHDAAQFSRPREDVRA